jgi:hypothetical protein
MLRIATLLSSLIFLAMLEKVLAPFFRQGRNGQADHVAVVDGIKAEIGGLNGFFNGPQACFFPRAGS